MSDEPDPVQIYWDSLASSVPDLQARVRTLEKAIRETLEWMEDPILLVALHAAGQRARRRRAQDLRAILDASGQDRPIT